MHHSENDSVPSLVIANITVLHKGTAMLILTRKIGEAIYIGENVQVVVLKMRSNQVQLGVAAPTSIKVLRGELVVDVACSQSGNTIDPPKTPREVA